MPDAKNIGKPCAGEPHARFDEGGQVKTYPLLYLHNWLLVPLLQEKRGLSFCHQVRVWSDF